MDHPRLGAALVGALIGARVELADELHLSIQKY